MCCSVFPPEIVMHDAYNGERFWQTKITRKTNDAAENLQLYRVVQFFHPRSSCMTKHISVDGHSENNNNASCMTVSGGRTKQLDIFCRVTGFTSDFLRFTVVELIRFFHESIQLGFCMPEITNIGSGYRHSTKYYKVSTQTCLVPWQGRGLV